MDRKRFFPPEEKVNTRLRYPNWTKQQAPDGLFLVVLGNKARAKRYLNLIQPKAIFYSILVKIGSRNHERTGGNEGNILCFVGCGRVLLTGEFAHGIGKDWGMVQESMKRRGVEWILPEWRIIPGIAGAQNIHLI